MPRPPNYITKLRRLAKGTNGDPLLKLSLLHTIQKYAAGEARLEELNKMVKEYSKTIVEDNMLDSISNQDLEDFLSDQEVH